MIETRPLMPGDLDACARVVDGAAFFRAYGLGGVVMRRELAAALRNGTADLRVALRATRVMGFAWLVPHGAFDRSGYLRLLAVEDAAHGQGAGTALMRALETDYLGSRDILLLVTETNTQARRFYEGLGYVLVGRLPGYVTPSVVECIYRKPARGALSPA